MSTFEPDAVRAWCVNTSEPSQRKAVDTAWKKAVEARWRGWEKSRKRSQSGYIPQLEWEANICEYVNFVTKQTHATTKGGLPSTLSMHIPLLGPRFVPPSFLHIKRRSITPEIVPDSAYLKPLTVVHPLFFPDLAVCPQCESTTDVHWNGWAPTGHREVHGVQQEETAIGFQLRCDACKMLHGGQTRNSEAVEQEDVPGYCFLTTNHQFWMKREHWEVPIGVPHFFKRCAVTTELFDLIVEFRPSGTAAGIAEHIKQLHILEYHKLRLAYLRAHTARSRQTTLVKYRAGLQVFSDPMTSGRHVAGYDCRSISDDYIGDIFNRFAARTRQPESELALRALGAVTISLDATFRSAGKATIVDKDKARTKVWTGGLQSVLNENNLIIAWRLCQTQANAEIEELLIGLKRRFELLNIAEPEMAVVDNCCHVKGSIRKVFSGTAVVLDVWHFMMRYMVCVLGGNKNPHHAAVAHDISSSILKASASNGNSAIYWSQEEQEQRLVEAYTKWSKKGGVWSAAAEKVHADQLAHVQKGCLARTRNDVRSDGSHIEGSHKGWNSLQRSHASGIESLTALGHDFVLRHNIRVDMASDSPSPFVASTHGSHHIGLVNALALMWNNLLDMKRKAGPLPAGLSYLPILEAASSGEVFGLMKMSAATAAHYTFIKEEPTNHLLDLTTLTDPAGVLGELGIDPSLAHLLPQPAIQSSTGSSTAAPVHSSPTSQSTSIAVNVVPPSPPRHAATSSKTSAHRSFLGNTVSFLQLPPHDVITLSSSDSGDEFPEDITEVMKTMDIRHAKITSQPPLSRSQAGPSRILAESNNIVEWDDTASQVDTEVLDQPPKKRARLTVPGNVTTIAKGKSKQQPSRSVGKFSDGGLSFFSSRALSVKVGRSSYQPPCLPILKVTGLTRSQQIFSLATGLDARSITFPRTEREEFYLFMRLRKVHQWASFNMTPQKWVVAASVYNSEVEKKNAAERKGLQRKTPRVLLEKLNEIEIDIADRLDRQHFLLKAGSTRFWREHCYAVALQFGPGNAIVREVDTIASVNNTIPKKLHTCKRCKAIMFPGHKGCKDNHGRGVCSDGAHSTAKKVGQTTIDGQFIEYTEESPPWPQPAGIFRKGSEFHVRPFLAALEEMYERVIIKEDTDSERTMEYLALTALLRSRLVFPPDNGEYASRVLFRLYDSLALKDCPKDVLVKYRGTNHLHINYLCEEAVGGSASTVAAPAAADSPVSPSSSG